MALLVRVDNSPYMVQPVIPGTDVANDPLVIGLNFGGHRFTR